MPIKAAVMTAPERPIELWSLKDPQIETGGMLIQTVASEVCGTDVHLHRGRLAGVPYPIVPGHVSVGRVVEDRGDGLDAVGVPLAPGDTVTFYDVNEICHECWFCRVAHQPNRCPSRKVYGITYSAHDGPLGGWAEQIYLKPGVRVLKLPEGLTSDQVIGGGCGLFTGFGAVETADIQLGDTVLIQGAGPVGLSAAAFASLRGAAQVVVIGDPESRLELARTLGADRTLSLSEGSQEERAAALLDMTGGRGPDVCIEASGNPRAVEEGLSITRDGGYYVIAGHYTDAGPATINPHLDINQKHVTVRGHWGTDFSHVHRALVLLAKHSDRFPFADIIGKRYGLEEAEKALEDVAALRVTKAIITPN